MSTAKLIYNGEEFEIPVVQGSEGEIALDIRKLRSTTGLIALDPGYGSTGSCTSAITFINGEEGILRYRGYPIEEISQSASFVEVCYLLIYGERPSQDELVQFQHDLTHHTLLHEDMKKFFEGYHPNSHPMAIMASMMASGVRMSNGWLSSLMDPRSSGAQLP